LIGELPLQENVLAVMTEKLVHKKSGSGASMKKQNLSEPLDARFREHDITQGLLLKLTIHELLRLGLSLNRFHPKLNTMPRVFV